MLVTVKSSASAKLSDLLSEAQLSQVELGITRQDGYFHVFIANTGANAVYCEIGADATTTGGAPISATSGTLGLTTDNLGKVNLIAATADTAVRIIIA